MLDKMKCSCSFDTTNVIAKYMLNFGCIHACRSLNWSQILQFEKISVPDADSESLKKKRSRSLKMWLRPLLFYFSQMCAMWSETNRLSYFAIQIQPWIF